MVKAIFFQCQRMKLETLAGQASDLLYTYDIYHVYIAIHFAFIFYFEAGFYQVAQTYCILP